MFIEKIINRERFRKKINNDNNINKTIIDQDFCFVLSRLNLNIVNTNRLSFLFRISLIIILKSRSLLINSASSSLWYQISSKNEMITSFFLRIFFYMSKFRSYAVIFFNDFFYFINSIVLQQFIFDILSNDCFVSTILFLNAVHVENSWNISSRECFQWSKLESFLSFYFFDCLIISLTKSQLLFLYFNALLFTLWISFIKILNFHLINILDGFDSKLIWISQSISCNRAFIATKTKNVLNTSVSFIIASNFSYIMMYFFIMHTNFLRNLSTFQSESSTFS